MSQHCLFCGGHVDHTETCELCGTVRASVDQKRIGAHCPRCPDARLAPFAIGPAVLQGCAQCRGMFAPTDEWDTLLDFNEEQPLPPETLLGPILLDQPYRNAPPSKQPGTLEDDVTCPTCKGPTDRVEFGGISRVLVDVCKLHGIWLDGGELTPVIQHVRDNPAITRDSIGNTYENLIKEPKDPRDSLAYLVASSIVRKIKRFL